MKREFSLHAKQLISENRILEAINYFLLELKVAGELRNQFLSVLDIYNLWNSNVEKGEISSSIYPSKIVFSLLQLIDFSEKVDDTSDYQSSHILHQFPRGPMVDSRVIRMQLKNEIAKIIPLDEALNFVDEINAFREEADPNDDRVTFISIDKLPNVHVVGSKSFWTRTIQEACMHGPRMLAALLFVIPDQYFSSEVSLMRQNILFKLSNI